MSQNVILHTAMNSAIMCFQKDEKLVEQLDGEQGVRIYGGDDSIEMKLRYNTKRYPDDWVLEVGGKELSMGDSKYPRLDWFIKAVYDEEARK